jgi:elongation factor P
VECQLRTPPNLRAFMQMTLRNLKTGKLSHLHSNPNESVDVLQNEVKMMEYSYKDGETYVFMDPVSFNTHELSGEILEEVIDFLVPNTQYEMLLVEDQPVSVTLPSSMVLEVVEAADGVKGDSATNVQKPVKLETGITINAPLFIKVGEKIRVNTAEHSYMGRA